MDIIRIFFHGCNYSPKHVNVCCFLLRLNTKFSVGIFCFSFHKVTFKCHWFVLNYTGEPSNISPHSTLGFALASVSHNGSSLCPCVVKTISVTKATFILCQLQFFHECHNFQKWSINSSRILNIYSNSASYTHLLPWFIKNLHIFQTFSYLSIWSVVL